VFQKLNLDELSIIYHQNVGLFKILYSKIVLLLPTLNRINLKCTLCQLAPDENTHY